MWYLQKVNFFLSIIMIIVFEVMYRGPTVPAAIRSLPARTPGVQISGFASLIVTCCRIFANAEKKKCVRSSGDFSAAELLCFARDQRDCQVPGKHRVEGPGRDWLDFTHKTVKTRNQSTSSEYAKYPMKPVPTLFGKRGWELRRFTGSLLTLSAEAEMEVVTAGDEREGPVTWKGAWRQMVSRSDGTFIVLGLDVPLSTVQTSAVWISAHLIFQRWAEHVN